MKLKKLVVAVLSIVFLLAGCQEDVKTDANGIPVRPNPPTAISDFANVIDDDLQSKYEAALTDLEAKTSIAVVVVTVPTFGPHFGSVEEYANKLFNTWGIGHKGSNNGVLLLFSMEEHKVRIEVGYGLEEFLTDASSGRIIDNNIIPHMKSKDPRAAFDDGITTLMNYVQHQIPSESQREMIRKQHEKEKQEARDKREKIFMNLAGVAVIILLVVLIYLLRKSYIKAQQKKKARKYASSLYKNINITLATVEPAVEKARAQIQTYPDWAKNEAEQYIAEVLRLMGKITDSMKSVESMIPEQPHEAIEKMNALQERYANANDAFEKSVKAIPAKIEFFKQKAPLSIVDTKQKLDDLFTLLGTYKTDGWRIFEDNLMEADKLKGELAAIDKLKEHKEICDACDALMQKILTETNTANAEYNLHSANNQRINAVEARIQETSGMLKNAKDSLAYLQKHAPKNVWNALAANITRAQQGFDSLPEKLSEAKKYNTKEEQRLTECDALLDSIESNLQRNSNLLMEVMEMHANWMSAEEKMPGLRQQVTTNLQNLQETVKHSDVSTVTKNGAKQAAKLFADTNGALNLIVVLAALQQLLQTIAHLESQADDEKKAAKKRRADAAKPKASTYSRTTYSSDTSNNWGSYSGGGGGGFGGFGGGGSGGGGATGTW